MIYQNIETIFFSFGRLSLDTDLSDTSAWSQICQKTKVKLLAIFTFCYLQNQIKSFFSNVWPKNQGASSKSVSYLAYSELIRKFVFRGNEW